MQSMFLTLLGQALCELLQRNAGSPADPALLGRPGRGLAWPVAAESQGQRLYPSPSRSFLRHAGQGAGVAAHTAHVLSSVCAAAELPGAPARIVHPIHPVSVCGALPSLAREPVPFSPEEWSGSASQPIWVLCRGFGGTDAARCGPHPPEGDDWGRSGLHGPREPSGASPHHHPQPRLPPSRFVVRKPSPEQRGALCGYAAGGATSGDRPSTPAVPGPS